MRLVACLLLWGVAPPLSLDDYWRLVEIEDMFLFFAFQALFSTVLKTVLPSPSVPKINAVTAVGVAVPGPVPTSQQCLMCIPSGPLGTLGMWQLVLSRLYQKT